MIRKNYQIKGGENVTMDKTKLANLKSKFPSTFREVNPEPVNIYVNDGYRFAVQKSIRSASIDPHQANMKTFKEAPTAEDIQLTYRVTDESGPGQFYSYSSLPPISNDPAGSQWEYPQNSGNMKKIGDKVSIQPQDIELLYFLYYYCPEFSNGEAPEKSARPKYYFYMPEAANSKEKSKKLEEAQLTIRINSFSPEQMERILSGLMKPVSADADTNFNALFSYVKNATPEQKELFESMAGSANTPKADAAEGEKRMPEYIQEWMAAGLIKLVPKDEDGVKPGWYWKAAKGMENPNDPDAYLKTAFAPVIAGSEDHRIDLVKYLENNTKRYEDLLKRWA